MTKDKQAQRQRRDDRARSAMTSRPRNQQRSPMTIALAAVGLVVAIVAAFVVIRLLTGASKNAKGAAVDAVPAAILRDVTSVPASAFDQVGTGGKLQLVYPAKLNGRPVRVGGKPYVMYLGADYCPFCAAERWSLVAALSRFGTFHNLRTTFSGSQDVFPNTPTFSFHGASYSSPYITFQGVETYTNTLVNGSYTPLDRPTALEGQLFTAYDRPPYFEKQGSIPFIDFANTYGVSGAGYEPTMMQGQTMAAVAAALTDPSSSTSQAVLGVSNSLSAAVCAIDGGKPASVCQSSGVKAAAKKFTGG